MKRQSSNHKFLLIINKYPIELISALGFPIIQAPSEGEAQAAFLVKNKDAYASLSQDADSLLFGCPLVVIVKIAPQFLRAVCQL